MIKFWFALYMTLCGMTIWLNLFHPLLRMRQLSKLFSIYRYKEIYRRKFKNWDFIHLHWSLTFYRDIFGKFKAGSLSWCFLNRNYPRFKPVIFKIKISHDTYTEPISYICLNHFCWILFFYAILTGIFFSAVVSHASSNFK